MLLQKIQNQQISPAGRKPSMYVGILFPFSDFFELARGLLAVSLFMRTVYERSHDRQQRQEPSERNLYGGTRK